MSENSVKITHVFSFLKDLVRQESQDGAGGGQWLRRCDRQTLASAGTP